MKSIELMDGTWSQALPVLLMVKEHASEEGRVFADEQLKNMARLADAYVALSEEFKFTNYPDEVSLSGIGNVADNFKGVK